MAKTLEERIDHYKAIAEKHGYVLLEECLGYRTPVLMCCKKHPKYKTKITLGMSIFLHTHALLIVLRCHKYRTAQNSIINYSLIKLFAAKYSS